MTLDEHAEELASDLGVDKQEVLEDLENLVSYSVPMDEAKQSLRRKYGDGGSGSTGEPASSSIGDITVDDSTVTVTAVVLTAGKRSIRYQGEDQVITEGELADESGRISYTAWEEFDLEPGAVVRIGNAGVREWEGDPELNLGGQTSVEPAEDDLDVTAPIGGERDLRDLEPGDRGRTVEVLVEEVETKVIDGRDGETEILSGVLADDSGRLPFTDWEPHEAIVEGTTLRLSDVFVREFRGVPSVNVSEFTTIDEVDATIEPPESAPEVPIREAVESGGLYDVELRGTVLAIREGSGLIERCPQCGRVVQNGQCRSHGAVEGVDDLRTRAILDDGTGTVTVVLDEDRTADVYGGDLEDALEAARDAMDREVVADDIRERIVGRVYRARGSLSVDDYGANLEATEFEPVESDPADRARTVLSEVRG